ncbi:helix-turn-helix domain-containing protein [Nocardia tengchongensis]|uniref:helix-turn-helix domain-containing protein n=1 Tax=Nocardia tengchongensis TaxID=2055889 RepID=UPI0036BE8308
MSGRHTRECRWCGDWFNVESPHSPALYCKRTHKTAVEKARKQLREAGIQPCPQPWSSAEPYRGPAIAAARRLGTRADECTCGSYHVRTPEQGRNRMGDTEIHSTLPRIKNPTSRDRLGLALAERQVDLIVSLREFREARGLTIDEVAVTMGVAPFLVIQLETAGTNPTMSALRAYAKAVGANFEITVTEWAETPE